MSVFLGVARREASEHREAMAEKLRRSSIKRFAFASDTPDTPCVGGRAKGGFGKAKSAKSEVGNASERSDSSGLRSPWRLRLQLGSRRCGVTASLGGLGLWKGTAASERLN